MTVTVKIASVAAVDAPRFTVCPDQSGSVCDLGQLPAGQSDELQASVKVRKAAALGEQIDLTARARAVGAASFHASASIVVIAAATPTQSTIPAAGGTLPTYTLPPLPDSGISPNDPSGLFPTVSPSPSSSLGSEAAVRASRRRDHLSAVTTAATLPLNPRLIGGQLAGLVVLACAIVIAIARLSLRTPRPQDSQDASK